MAPCPEELQDWEGFWQITLYFVFHKLPRFRNVLAGSAVILGCLAYVATRCVLPAALPAVRVVLTPARSEP